MARKLPPCEFATVPHHSNDRTKVYCGETQPVILCGYHASTAWLATAIREAKSARDGK